MHCYTGDGKGKSSAAIGLAVRAVGQGFKVAILQFMKGGAYTGEMIAAKHFLPNIDFWQYGKGCIKEPKQLKILEFGEDPKSVKRDWIRDDIVCGPCRYCFVNDEDMHAYVSEAYEKAKEVLTSGKYHIVVLDEITHAMNAKFITLDQVKNLIHDKDKDTELIMTGRDLPKEIAELCDLITEMKLVKHYYDQGVMARRGIEY